MFDHPLGTRRRRGFGLRPEQRANSLARDGFVPHRRTGHRDYRTADQGGRVHARGRARQDGSQRQVPGRADVRAVLPAAEPQGQAAAAVVARRRLDRRDLRDQARRRRWLAHLFHPQGLGHLHLRRRGARPRRLDQHLQRGAAVLAGRRSVGALSHRPARVMERRQSQTRELSRRPVPDRRLRAVHEAGRAALAYHRRADRGRLCRTRRRGLPLRGPGAQSVGLVRLQGARGAAGEGQGAHRRRADARRGPQ